MAIRKWHALCFSWSSSLSFVICCRFVFCQCTANSRLKSNIQHKTHGHMLVNWRAARTTFTKVEVQIMFWNCTLLVWPHTIGIYEFHLHSFSRVHLFWFRWIVNEWRHIFGFGCVRSVFVARSRHFDQTHRFDWRFEFFDIKQQRCLTLSAYKALCSFRSVLFWCDDDNRIDRSNENRIQIREKLWLFRFIPMSWMRYRTMSKSKIHQWYYGWRAMFEELTMWMPRWC